MTCPILFPSSGYYGFLKDTAVFLHLPVLKSGSWRQLQHVVVVLRTLTFSSLNVRGREGEKRTEKG